MHDAHFLPLSTLQGPDTLPLLEDVGRLLLLDMLLGNADRLPLPELGWRGNRSNVLLGAQGEQGLAMQGYGSK
jgi:hypothetical protein